MRPPSPPHQPRKRAGKLRPQLPFSWRNKCWLCDRHASIRWGGKHWCWRHHPLRPTLRHKGNPTMLVSESSLSRWHSFSGLGRSHTDTSDKDIDRHQRKVDSILGRKKRKPAKPRKQSRDRKYRR